MLRGLSAVGASCMHLIDDTVHYVKLTEKYKESYKTHYLQYEQKYFGMQI